MRECTLCRRTLPVSDFYKYSRTQRTFSRCKACCKREATKAWRRSLSPEHRHRRQVKSRKANLRANYGLSWEQFCAMLAAQSGRCAICSTEISFEKKRSYAVDHDHATGKVRSILCPPCNAGLGSFRDDPDRMTKAAQYVLLHRGGDDVKSV